MATNRLKTTRRRRKTKENTVLVVDGQPMLRRGLASFIEQEVKLWVDTEDNIHDALRNLDKNQPSMVIFDIQLNENSSLEFIKKVMARKLKTKMLVLSICDEILYAERTIRAGARGYIMKSASEKELKTAIDKVRNGDVYLSERMTSRVLTRLITHSINGGTSPIKELTDRELEAFILISRGFATQEIAKKMNLSPNTLDNYRCSMKDKLNLESSNELLQYAIKWANKEKHY